MATPQLYRQLLQQLGQWIIPKDLRHLKNCAEIVAAILESESACLTDPQSRIMKNSGNRGFDQHYNGQIAVDQQALLIRAC